MAYSAAFPNPPGSQTTVSDSHELKRYSWRAFLGIVGPLALTGFYAYISLYYINDQPGHDILTDSRIDAIVPFYAWVVVSIFTLDWARTALANYEAAAVMRPVYAPKTAMQLFWHADNNWANPLWWLRAIRNISFRLFSRRGQYSTGHANKYASTPGLLWAFLSTTSVLVFVAVPLSGLTMELVPVSKPGSRRASILGPTPNTFNAMGRNGIASVIDGIWRAGGKASPSDTSYFYAPDGAQNVSLTYFEDMAQAKDDSEIITFLGPALNDIVSGRAFGMQSSVQCGQVAVKDLHLISGHQYPNGYEVNYRGSDPTPTNGSKGAADGAGFTMVFLNETHRTDGFIPYSFIAAADGSYSGSSPFAIAGGLGPTFQNGAQSTGEDGTDARTTYLEMFLWQGEYENIDDPILESLLSDESPMVEKITVPAVSSQGTSRFAGFAIQCSVLAAVGYAELDPATRTYRNFENTTARSSGTDNDVYSPSMLAVMALSDWDTQRYQPRQIDTGSLESRFISLNQGIGRPAREMCVSSCNSEFSSNGSYYLSLSPDNVAYSLTRLIGQSIIVSMGAKSQDPYEDELFLLESARWLKPGPIPWQLVLALLGLWAIVTSGLSIWTLFTKRWAPTMSGFELFRLGAQYTEDVNLLEGHRFEASDVLNSIPGMVGVMHGGSSTGVDGFIGLSDKQADQDGRFVYDRKRAAVQVRP